MNITTGWQYALFILMVFALVIIGTALIVGGLCFFPALALGPIVEHFQMMH